MVDYLKMLGPEHLKILGPDHLKRLHPDHLKMLEPDHPKMLEPDHLKRLDPVRPELEEQVVSCVKELFSFSLTTLLFYFPVLN